MATTAPEALPTNTVAASLSATVKAEVLELSFRLRNHGTVPVYLFSRPQRWADYGAPDALGKWFSLVELRTDGTLALAMIVPRVPPGMSVEVLQVPCAVLLAPGEEVSERVSVPLPVGEYSPYSPLTPQTPAQNAVSQRLELWADYVAAGAGVVATPDADSGCFKVTGFARRMVHRAVAGADSIRIPVRRRLDMPR